jgi:tRNA-modifying protein YgfZ
MVLRISAPPMFAHEQYDALRNGAGLLDRRARGRLELTGADRLNYLQGLLTNDIQALQPGTGCYAALLTPQGRMISDMRVSELGAKVLIDLPDSTAEAVRLRLADFIFSEDVEVFDIRPSHVQFGLYGPRASEYLAAVLTQPTEADYAPPPRARLEGMALHGNAPWQFGGAIVDVVCSDDFGVRGFELFVDADAAPDFSKALLERGALEVSAASVDVTRVEAGRPEFGVDMDEHTIPLEAGIEDRAISLTKGCYVGQEIIIRVLHRGGGRVAKHLVGLISPPSGKGFERADRLFADGRDVGSVTSAVISPALDRPIGLGYVHRDHSTPGTVLQAGTEARPVTVAAVPFISPAA